MKNPRQKLIDRAARWQKSAEYSLTDRLNTVRAEPRTYAVCVMCGEGLIGRRRHTKTCSETCRSALREERKLVVRTLDHLLWGIGDLEEMIQQPDPIMAERARQALKMIRDGVLEACREVGV